MTKAEKSCDKPSAGWSPWGLGARLSPGPKARNRGRRWRNSVRGQRTENPRGRGRPLVQVLKSKGFRVVQRQERTRVSSPAALCPCPFSAVVLSGPPAGWTVPTNTQGKSLPPVPSDLCANPLQKPHTDAHNHTLPGSQVFLSAVERILKITPQAANPIRLIRLIPVTSFNQDHCLRGPSLKVTMGVMVSTEKS